MWPSGCDRSSPGMTICFYAEKFLVPMGLCLDYGRTPHACWPTPARRACGSRAPRDRGHLCRAAACEPSLAVMLVVAGLLPVLGLVPFTFQGFWAVADRYTYLPMLGAARWCRAGGSPRPPDARHGGSGRIHVVGVGVDDVDVRPASDVAD